MIPVLVIILSAYALIAMIITAAMQNELPYGAKSSDYYEAAGVGFLWLLYVLKAIILSLKAGFIGLFK